MRAAHPSFVNFSGYIWRIHWASQPDQVLQAARAPEGRFHYNGQSALYASLSPTGAGVAVGYYLQPNDPPRIITELHLVSDRIIDASDAETARQIGFGIADTTWRWQIDREAKVAARTWNVSDKLRDLDADGMIFRSNQRPDLHHIALFHWNTNQPTSLSVTGTSLPWTP